MTRRPTSSLLATVALVVVLAVAVTALVLFDRGADGDPASATPSQTPSAPPPEPTEPAEPTELPVPDGVVLTDPGTELALGDAATVAWKPRQEEVGVIEVEVREAERTTFARSFAGWQLDDATRATTPWFVRVAVRNEGESDLGGRAVPLYGLGASGSLVPAASFATRFEPCPGNGLFPQEFGPQELAERCLVVLVPEGDELQGVAFRPTEEFEGIVWEVPEPDQREDQQRRRQDRGAQEDAPR
ncbi:hypothetical protein [Nocardioides nanhaiensis]|uniref:DUF4352 domain-containing protein n=1 Tax=Nocardioides nanhaiensis TaxID=1476871 RepID=A0ABP8WQJ2_9ACTN